MLTNFKPVYTINAAIAKHLMRIEDAKEKVAKSVFVNLGPSRSDYTLKLNNLYSM